MSSILVKDYMQSSVQAVKANASVRELVEYLLKWNVTGLPVIDEHMRVIGFISEQDCIKEMLNSAFYAEDSAQVRSIMRSDVLTVTPDTSILEIAETMLGNKPKNYPVIEQGKLVGLISRRMILQALRDNNVAYFSPHNKPLSTVQVRTPFN
ncbi:CBS domain-containing protein [Cellvibrio japonicus]|uniref:CBS domain protein n=1 Tax=Cellvibrio japonicus (strain Ueda107) TaxID=498211 RepID=B3PBR4_CELJU|nr:CBS domain-containing protein [Cellvibrio japonicus]ACE84832.1 CBS domain protein [Cellvibrio japonicus Ueda107]QEI11735.1 CBS domain-containing protein [Cellvibrio japonicus]QEI15309.1 CBS domain-containing protein [Cellvibrio japonicus]QEI18889.1 CBS domain-containing protein [Cellvibrio japonicus]